MDKDKAFAIKYQEKIDEYVDKNYATKLTFAEADADNSKIWYLPHFCVKNVNKPGKLRFVMDAAAKSSGVSLNDACLKGPDILKSLLTILWKFRRYRVAFTADIKEIFHQVVIRKEDRVGQRFLWRGIDRNREPDVYEMNVMIFGSISSPYIAQYVKNHNADLWSNKYQAASDAIKNLHYVDDYLDSVETDEDAVKKITEVIQVHKYGGFIICNWICSSKNVLEYIPKELRATSNNSKLERVLGVFWNSSEDIICFNTNNIKCDDDIKIGKRRPTKREMLKIIMSIFDPCGFLANIIIVAKILFQDLWRKQIDWDQEVPEDIHIRWKKWIFALEYINHLTIPRCYFKVNPKVVELHVFADASEQAFGVVAYFRTKTENQFEVSFVAAKARVSSMKFTTIPRMELQAAVVASRLGSTLQNESGFKISSTTYWSDSRIVLSWIQADARIYKSFVSNRISEILENSSVNEWKWISTIDNPADKVTREIYTFDTARWYKGPEFLLTPEEDWVQNKNIMESTGEELRKKYKSDVEIVCINDCKDYEVVGPDINRFLKYTKYIRCMAWILRFIKNCREFIPVNRLYSELTYQEFREAEIMIFRNSQSTHFAEDINRTRRNLRVHKNSKLRNISINIDVDGLLRLQGRIQHSTVMSDTKNPIIIAKTDKNLVYLLISYYHTKCGHQGANFVCNEIREKYFISNLKNLVKKIVRSCIECQKLTCTPNVQLMGQLPPARLKNNILPLKNTGVDFFGPIWIRYGRKHEKRYGVLFTCMVVRAIHLEIAENLTTDSTIMAVQRFIARRGQPENIFLDNGTNFHGAAREIKEMLKNIHKDVILQEMSIKGINWHFNPPAAPHMGGVWERLVRSVKRAMSVCLKEKYPREETLQTIFAEIEFTLNNRPLTDVSVDYEDPESLTPNHFLIGTTCNTLTTSIDEQINLRHEWKKSIHTANMFWKRWLKEYLPQLVRSFKWNHGKINVNVNDIE